MATYTTLKSGSTGDDVKKLQTALGFTGKDVDGIYGKKTQQAVTDYQKANGLTVDGIAGNQTLGSLYATAPATTPSATTPQQSNTYQYEAFTYDPYEKSDIVKQAEASIQQHIDANKQSPWSDTLNDTINKILNKEEFSYDLNGDALYQQYKDQYTTQGQMAMMDTMGQAAAMTGGYGNSYAQSVGQQTYQGYMQQLNDKVPELYQIALNQYNQENQDLKDQASILNTLVQQDNDNYYRDLEYLTGRADKLASDDYTQWRDKFGMDYNIHSDSQTAGYQEKSDAYTHAMSMLSLGITPDAAELEKAGISPEKAQEIVKKVNDNAKASAASISGDTSKKITFEDHDKVMSYIQPYIDDGDSEGLWDMIEFLISSELITKEYGYQLYNKYLPEEEKEAPKYEQQNNTYRVNKFLTNMAF